MKIDRLLGITTYLLTHERASAAVLAGHFEVSRRTIQRDIDALCRAGLPIGAFYGSGGGYELLRTFPIDRQPAFGSDYAYIRSALEGLVSAGKDPRAQRLLERLGAADAESGQTVFLDFSAALEGSDMAEKLRTVEQAIWQRETLRFNYCDASGNESQRQVEPIALCYRWYDWYLLAYCSLREDYRLFRLSRITQADRGGRSFSRTHKSSRLILKQLDETDSRRYLSIEVYCRAGTRLPELLQRGEREERGNGDFLLRLHLPKEESAWRGALLSLGGDAQILSPAGLRNELCKAAAGFLSANGDRQLSPFI